LEEHDAKDLDYRKHWVEVPNRITRFYSKREAQREGKNAFQVENTREIEEADWDSDYDTDPMDDDDKYQDNDLDEAEDELYWGFSVVDNESEDEKDELRLDLRSKIKKILLFVDKLGNVDKIIADEFQAENFESALKKVRKMIFSK
jgi:hypothetical protein